MIKQEIINKLKEIAKEKKIKIDDSNLSKSFKELGIDSMSSISLLIEIESKFDITFPDDKLVQIKNYNELINTIEELKK
ncbi:MAG: phosphopantetheine-binding protein [Mycoplasmataceae bacterium]|jgi:acyl carrier protein|nr:phosphopantetheine-binding protein [Mycoplasmataceae bacterium]